MLRKDERIRSGTRINEIRKKRQFHYSSTLLQFIAAEGTSDTRLAVICSKYLGNAAKRNRIKRLLRAAFRRNKHNIAKKIDIVIIVKRQQLCDGDYEKELNRFIGCVSNSDKNVVNIPKN